jgi:tetratricopeptide (TPR) repeat protein
MKDKALKQLLKTKEVSSIMSLLDKNGATSLIGPVAHLAKDLAECDYAIQGDVFQVYIPSPHKLLLVDKLKWFGMLPVIMKGTFQVELHVPTLPEIDELDSPFQKALSKVPTITIIEHKQAPKDLTFDYILYCHNDLDDQSVASIKETDYERALFMFWSEMDYLINSKYLKANNIIIGEPSLSDYSVSSGVEEGSGWCLVTSSMKEIEENASTDEKALAESRFLKAMYNHSSQIGYTNPRTRPGNPIQDMRINNVLRPQMVYVIDNLTLDLANGLLYEYKKNRETFLVSEVTDSKTPPESKNFIEKLLWAYTIKAIYHLKTSENGEYNQAAYSAIKEYAKHVDSEATKQLMIGSILEIEGNKEAALEHYLKNLELQSAEIYYRAGALSTQLQQQGSLARFATASKLGSSISAYNYAVMLIEQGLTQESLPVCIDHLTQSASNGFEPAQCSLAELMIQIGKPKTGSKWLRKSAENGNMDSAYNLVIVLKDLYDAGQCEKFELKKAQKALKDAERIHRVSLNSQNRV